MREIKFRAWDKIKKIMVRVISLDLYVTRPTVVSLPTVVSMCGELGDIWTKEIDNVELMQYTGIRDKNGKEIYEGDILSGIAFYNGNDYGGPVKKEEYYIHKDVEFSEGCYMCGGFALNEISRYMEVIGNIYENPELINKGKD